MEDMLRKIFVHAGIVTDLSVDAKDETTAVIKVSWIPWGYCGLEHVTQQLLNAGTIQNDEYLYFRSKNIKDVVTATLTIDFTNKDWHVELIKQLGLILVREVKTSMAENE